MPALHVCVLCKQERSATFAFAEDKDGLGLRVCWLCLRAKPWEKVAA